MKFTKMHGIGNDYIYFNCLDNDIKDPNGLSIALSDRHFGVGGDGIVMIMRSEIADFRMRMFNADGSEGKMCGNATRCIGKYVYEKGLTDKTEFTLETLGGIKVLKLNVSDGKVISVTVDMGKAILKPADIPVLLDGDCIVSKKTILAGKEHEITCVSMGNPHCVIFTKDIDNLNLEKIGPDYENDPIFPERVNTEFVEIIDNKTLKMRVWERGSGETWACGTGASAVCVAAVLNGICDYDTDVLVKLRGGDLTINYKKDGTVYMTGPATFVFDGELEKEFDIYA
ncbi:MAG: diaminopimelate epimerase [Acutalibacteraceae bacterium]|nr:diaminopimelate epimerase [Clostridia bacterium]MEE1128009.1 diaminopimelate epimerase [Acutalibacteraceae bacterium]